MEDVVCLATFSHWETELGNWVREKEVRHAILPAPGAQDDRRLDVADPDLGVRPLIPAAMAILPDFHLPKAVQHPNRSQPNLV